MLRSWPFEALTLKCWGGELSSNPAPLAVLAAKSGVFTTLSIPPKQLYPTAIPPNVAKKSAVPHHVLTMAVCLQFYTSPLKIVAGSIRHSLNPRGFLIAVNSRLFLFTASAFDAGRQDIIWIGWLHLRNLTVTTEAARMVFLLQTSCLPNVSYLIATTAA